MYTPLQTRQRHSPQSALAKPHRVRTFKLSRDPEFSEKLEDIVGLYLNPPEHAIVLCADEKSQIPVPGPHPARACP